MGMFDTVICKYKLPDEEVQDAEFQTKSFVLPSLDTYEITEDGNLLIRQGYYLPGEEKWVHESDEQMYYTGVINFYTSRGDGRPYVWYEYDAEFFRGKLMSLIKKDDLSKW